MDASSAISDRRAAPARELVKEAWESSGASVLWAARGRDCSAALKSSRRSRRWASLGIPAKSPLDLAVECEKCCGWFAQWTLTPRFGIRALRGAPREEEEDLSEEIGNLFGIPVNSLICLVRSTSTRRGGSTCF